MEYGIRMPGFHDSLSLYLSEELHIEKLQRRALRIIYPTLALVCGALVEADVVTLFDRRQYFTIVVNFF